MFWMETLAIAVALGCDAFAVGLGVGVSHRAPRQIFRLSLHFGVFQLLMPIIGWQAGRYLVEFTERYAPWIAAAILVYIGLNMIRQAFGDPEQQQEGSDPTKGWSLVVLSLATSIDALGVGFSMGLTSQPVLSAALIIGVVASVMTVSGMLLGGVLGARFGQRMGAFGGLVLLGIAVKMVLA